MLVSMCYLCHTYFMYTVIDQGNPNPQEENS